jgi:uncharacterized DUF497 family protein
VLFYRVSTLRIPIRIKENGLFAGTIRVLEYAYEYMYYSRMDSFEWDEAKNEANQGKHGVSFETAQEAFLDPKRIIALDKTHSSHEKRYYCMGKVGGGIMTVRFTYRERKIRIIGAGYWRKGKKTYEEEN